MIRLKRRRVQRRRIGVWPDYATKWDDRLKTTVAIRAERRDQRRAASTRSSAYHEAGHVVATLVEYGPDELWGARIGLVEKGHRLGGGTTYSVLGGMWHPRLAELIISMAGVLAEGYAVISTEDCLKFGANTDSQYQMALYAGLRNINSAMRHYERAYLLADGLVKKHRRLIDRIALRLLRDGRIGINRPAKRAWTRPRVGSKVRR
jgi:hypothetical protein